MAVYLGDLAEHGLAPATLETLRSNGIATLGDLAEAMGALRLGDFLRDDERVDVNRAVWGWIRARFPRREG